MTNQVSDQVGTSYVTNPTIDVRTPGGTGKNFECNLRIAVCVEPIETEKEHPVFQKKLFRGWTVKYRVFKNKLGIKNPNTNRPATGEFLFTPKPGFSNADAVLKIGIHLGFVGVGGSWYTFFPGMVGERQVQGAERAKAYLKTNKHVYDRLLADVMNNSEDFYSMEEEAAAKMQDELREDSPEDFAEEAIEATKALCEAPGEVAA